MTDQAPVRYLHPVEPVHAAESPVAEGPAGWEPYLPLTPERQLPAFPLGGLPGWLHNMITETATALQVPADLPATLGLAGLAVAAGGRVDVSPIPGWVEPTNLYTVIALAPGSRKSPTFNAMTQPLRDAEQALCDATETQRLQASLEARRIRAQAEKAARAAELADKDPDSAMAEAMSAGQAVYDLIDQPEPRLLADDLTPETAASLLAQHGGRLGILSAEGGSFATVAGVRYSPTANLETLLKAHAGDMIRIDRKGRPAERIERPALTIAITTQPGNLATIARTPEARERGLLARFLYCLPVNTVGRRPIHPPPVTEPTRNAYAAHLHGLVLDLALVELRELVRGVYPQVLVERGLATALSDLASRSPVAVDTRLSTEDRYPPPVETAIYFAVAEALTNVAKQARAGLATVSLDWRTGRLIAEVTDDGMGGADPNVGSGMLGLADRLAVVDGRMYVSSPSGGPTVVRFEVPCQPLTCP